MISRKPNGRRNVNLDRTGTGGTGHRCEECGVGRACVSHVTRNAYGTICRVQLCGPCWVPRYLSRFPDGEYRMGVDHQQVSAMPGVNPHSDHDVVMAARRADMRRREQRA